jgi:glucose-6-phosphate 1-dehydrogenase
MDFRYESSFEWASPEAYESLLLDVCMGEPTLFIRTDEVEASWRFVDSIRTAWDHSGLPAMEQYAPGSWGPQQARRLFDDPYAHWFPE